MSEKQAGAMRPWNDNAAGDKKPSDWLEKNGMAGVTVELVAGGGFEPPTFGL